MNMYLFHGKEANKCQSGQCSKGISKGFQNQNIVDKNVNVTCNLIRKKVSTGMNEKYGEDSTRIYLSIYGP